MSEPDSNDYLEALEQLRNMAALATGLRTDLIKEGWSVDGAEQIAIAIMHRAMTAQS